MRFGTMNRARPPGPNTRKLSSSTVPEFSAVSSPCITISRSTNPVDKGQAASSHSTLTLASPVGHGITPCGAGISAMTRRERAR